MITIDQIICQLQRQDLPREKQHAAVLLPIVEVNNELHLLFQVRSMQLEWQPGDICFPGGRIEINDLNAESAALRETHEELGISLEAITVLGKLPEVMTNFGFNIYPFVGKITSLDTLSINRDEVAEIFTVPIQWLIQNPPLKASIQVAHKADNDFPFELLPNRSKQWQKREKYPVYFYHFNQYVIWGLTAQMINLFLATVTIQKNNGKDRNNI